MIASREDKYYWWCFYNNNNNNNNNQSLIYAHIYIRPTAQEQKNSVHVIRNTAHRPSTQASYTASRVRLNKEIQLWRLYRYCGAMYGFVLGLGLVIAKRDFSFETKTRPSLSYKVLEARPRLLHSRLESRARPLSNELELTRDPRLWSRGHKSVWVNRLYNWK